MLRWAVTDLGPYTIVQEITKQDDLSQQPVAAMTIVWHFTTGHAQPFSPFAFVDDELEVCLFYTTFPLLSR